MLDRQSEGTYTASDNALHGGGSGYLRLVANSQLASYVSFSI